MTAPWSDTLNRLYLACTCMQVDHGSESYPEPRMNHCNFHAAATDMYQALEQVDAYFAEMDKDGTPYRAAVWSAVKYALAEANK